jgi:hypothetical protein
VDTFGPLEAAARRRHADIVARAPSFDVPVATLRDRVRRRPDATPRERRASFGVAAPDRTATACDDLDVTRRRGRSEPDLVSKLHEDARWSMYTNSVVRWPEWVRGGRGLTPRRRDKTFVPFMILTLVFFAMLGAGVAAVILILNLASH